MNKAIYSMVRIDLTHRCNFQCPFCAKGEAENVDITTEIIDKTLSELQDSYINSLELAGGEPCLTPKMIVYIVNEIVKRKILIGHFGIFTNGTIIDEAIRKSFCVISDYLKRIEPQLPKYSEENAEFIVNSNSRTTMVISTNGRKSNNETIQKAKSFYGSSIKVVLDEGNTGGLIIVGNLLKNHKEVLQSELSIKNNSFAEPFQYNIIRNYNYSKESINKDCDLIVSATISIAADGKVYIGNGVSYDIIKKYSPFNIMDCNNDLIERLESYSWKFPVNFKIMSIRNKQKLFKWAKENKYAIKEDTIEMRNLLKQCITYSNLYEKIAIQLHNNSPHLNHTEVDYVSTLIAALLMIKDNTTIEEVQQILYCCSEFDISLISSLTVEFAERLLLAYIDNANKRIDGGK